MKTAEPNNPATGIFTALIANTKAGRTSHTATSLPGRRALLDGALGADIYDPAAKRFSATRARRSIATCTPPPWNGWEHGGEISFA